MTEVLELTRGEFLITTDPDRMDVGAIHSFLSSSYWSAGIPRDIVERAVQNSLCFGLFAGTAQIGFARIVTDKATFAYLCDVTKDAHELYRKAGFAQLQNPDGYIVTDKATFAYLCDVTKDAHELYRKAGFAQLQNPDGYMEIFHPAIYLGEKAWGEITADKRISSNFGIRMGA